MNAVALLIGLGPLLGWGLFPTVAAKIGGKPVNQIIGTAFGTFIFALVYALINGYALPSGIDLMWTILSGIGWASAQIITFMSFRMVGSSRAMPITTAFQLIGTSLWGVFVLGDWPGLAPKVVGFLALFVIIAGAYMTVWQEHKTSSKAGVLSKAVGMLAVGEIGYLIYSAAPQAAAAHGVNGQQAFLPQAIGMVIVGVVYGLVKSSPESKPLLEAVSYKHIISGFFFAFAALTYLISAQPDMNGLATGFILSQTSVVLATLTGIWFLGEKKTKREMQVTMVGLVLILLAATVTVMI
ncbi:MAG: GRP family sugar transporter [Aerococcus sp.]|nr:GRP family sugar transporter [Aerococcus sp.]